VTSVGIEPDYAIMVAMKVAL